MTIASQLGEWHRARASSVRYSELAGRGDRKKSLDPTTDVHVSQQNVSDTYRASGCAHSLTEKGEGERGR